MANDETPAPLAKKLTLKPGHKLLIVHAPAGYHATLGALPTGVTLTEIGDLAGLVNAPAGAFDVAQVFFTQRAEVDQAASLAIRALKPGGALWLCYPKLTGRRPKGAQEEDIASDLTRDYGWESMSKEGWRPVTQIAIDVTWSALRFKPIG